MCDLLTLNFCLLCHVQVLVLNNNKISDSGLTAFAKAVESGALAALERLGLGDNAIGDAGMSALAKAITPGPNGKGALDKLTVSWCPTALSSCPETSCVHSPDSEHLFDVQCAGTSAPIQQHWQCRPHRFC